MGKQFFLFSFAALLLLSSCGNQTPTESAATEETTAVTVETAEPNPLDGVEFSGETVKIFATDYQDFGCLANVYAPEQNGEVLNDAVYRKNAAVQELLDVEFSWTEYPFTWDDRTVMTQTVQSSVMSGDSYDLMMIPTAFSSSMIAEGLYANLSDLPYIDFDNPWYSDTFIQNASIGDKVYMAAGDGVLPFLTGLFCYAYNSELLNQYMLDDPRELVDEGKWTFDKMSELSKAVYEDLNGNGKRDSEDQFGLDLLGNDRINPFLDALEATSVLREGDTYILNYASEHGNDVFNAVFGLIHENDSVWTKGDVNDRTTSPFSNGRALFITTLLSDLYHFRDVDFGWGVLPYPKWDEAQQSYHCGTGTALSTLCVPVTASGSKKSGAVIEAMGIFGYKYTTPAYCETTLKVKYSDSDASAHMFDILRENATIEIGSMLSSFIGSPRELFSSTVLNNKKAGTWASVTEAKKDKFLAKLNEYTEIVKALEN